MDSLNDFFAIIGDGKSKVEKERKDLIGDIKLEGLFASLETERKKTKKDKKKLEREVAAFESFLFSGPKEVSEEDNTKKAVKILETELLNLKNTSYKSIDRLMKGICSEHNITPLQLHNGFKEKHGVIPDEWVKQQKEEVDTTNWRDDYKPIEIETEDIIKPEPLQPSENKVEVNETIEKSKQILEKLIPEEEKIEEGQDEEIRRLKREMDQLRKMVYESVRTATAQGGGGEVRLEYLDDVDRNSAKQNGFYLKYDETLDKWVGAPVGGGATTFAELTDVDSSTRNGNSIVYNSGTGKFIGTDILGNLRQLISDQVNDGDVVVYSASAGRFIATSQGNLTGAGRTTLATLDDVDITGITTNDVLIFNGTDFEFTTPFEVMDRSDGTDDDTLDYGSF